METFAQLQLQESIIQGLQKQNIHAPTPIQEQVIPIILSGKDVIAQSKTGSGKTLAYLLPLFMQVEVQLRATQAIIITPTHELAVQVHRQIELLAKNSQLEIRSALIIGGAGSARQIEKLKEKPQIVVGSAGRILDFIRKKKISAHTIKAIVIDEADRMLDEWNIETVQAIIKTTLKQRQLIMVSATISPKTQKTAIQLMNEPQLIAVEAVEKLPKTIRHIYMECERREKINFVRKIVSGLKPEKAIVFLNNTENINVTVEKLLYHKLKVVGIYGTAQSLQRKNAIEDFREGRANLLVSSDISARGLDFPQVELVINLDIPEQPTHYLHRAGRTGRNGARGDVISLVTYSEKKWIRQYEKEFDIVFLHQEMSFGKMQNVKQAKGKKVQHSLIHSSQNSYLSKTEKNTEKKETLSYKNKEKKNKK